MRTYNLSNKKNQAVINLQYAIVGSVILYFGRALFIPLSFAALISFVLYPVCKWLERKGLKRLLAILISISIVILFFAAVVILLISQFSTFLKEWPTIQWKINEALDDLSIYLYETLSMSKSQQQEWISKVESSSSAALFTIVKQFWSASIANLVLIVIIPVFSALILFYRKLLVEALFLVFPKRSKFRIQNILLLTIGSYYNFIKGMIVVYAVVGILNSVGLLLLGVPHALFFGFAAAILTFIPYVGIIVGSLLPMAMAWITFNSIWYAMGVVMIFSFVQYLEANVIFPLAVSNRLNVNALATLIAIITGGILWGVSGMVLFVPFLAILKLIADREPQLKIISILIGTGKSQHQNLMQRDSIEHRT